MQKLEKEIEKNLVKFIKSKGGIAFKFISPGNAGVPDRLCVMPRGIVIFVELKKFKTGVESKLQIKQAERIQKLGHLTCVVVGEEGLAKFKKEVEKLGF